MRRITANIIYPVSSPPIKNAYIELDDNNHIKCIVPYERGNNEPHHLEYFSGVLVPGFVNAHCHLELSHLKDKIEEGKGLKNFVKEVQKIRFKEADKIEKAAEKAIKYMYSRGINAIGDIVNNALAVDSKNSSEMQFYNFIELFNEGSKTTYNIIQRGSEIIANFNDDDASFVPHSMYGTNRELLKAIDAINLNEHLSSMHFLESHWEAGINANRILSYLKQITCASNVLLIHNLFLNDEIFQLIKADKELFEQIFWVTCPNSNLYINGQLPPIEKFVSWNLKLCIGTDSLASNKQLSIFDEMKTISKAHPEIDFDTILKWATINGAEALNMQSWLGSFDKNKSPGVILIENFDFKRNNLCDQSEVKRII